MSSILDAFGKVEGSAAGNSGHDGPPTSSSSEGPLPDGPPQGQRVGRRSRWVIVVLVSGLGLALGRFLGDSQVTPALVVEATKVSPWPVVPVAKPTAPAVVDRPVPKVVAGDGLAGRAAAREKALVEGGAEGLKNFDKAFPAFAAAAKKAKAVLGLPPEGAPRVDILFLQWASERDERLASLRSQGGSLSVVYEGDVIDGMAVASIHADEILFTWRGVTFRQPVHRY